MADASFARCSGRVGRYGCWFQRCGGPILRRGRRVQRLDCWFCEMAGLSCDPRHCIRPVAGGGDDLVDGLRDVAGRFSDLADALCEMTAGFRHVATRNAPVPDVSAKWQGVFPIWPRIRRAGRRFSRDGRCVCQVGPLFQRCFRPFRPVATRSCEVAGEFRHLSGELVDVASGFRIQADAFSGGGRRFTRMGARYGRLPNWRGVLVMSAGF